MKTKVLVSLFLLGSALVARADQLVPAGSVITCTIAENKISSKTEKIGDPILCQLGHSEAYGRNSFPYGTYLIGHFQDYKDPGHFVGKGWIELRFDRMVVQPDTIVPINARVVQTPKYPVDNDGRIHGTGHPVKDTVEWLIPVLWPLDIINLPRRGPYPTLAPETKLTLKVLDDFGIPTPMENAVRTPALVSRITPDEPTYQSYRAPVERQQPVQQSYAAPQQSYAPQPQYSQTPQVVVNVNQPQPQPRQVQRTYVVQPPVVYAPPVYPPYGYYYYRMGPYGPY
jgi:hypothetical protein